MLQRGGPPGTAVCIRNAASHRWPGSCLQAIARIFRYGQTKTTFVYRMYFNGTVQVSMYRLETQRIVASKPTARHWRILLLC